MVRSLHPGLFLLGLLLVLPLGAQAETWLRGSGSDVWIEEDGKYQPPRENHRGFTRVAATRRPVVYADPPVHRTRYVYGPTVIVRDRVVVYGAVPWYGLRHYRHGTYSGHRYDHYRPYRRHYSRSSYRGYGGRHRYSSGRGYGSSHRSSHVRSGRSSLGAVRGVRGAVGGGSRGRRH